MEDILGNKINIGDNVDYFDIDISSWKRITTEDSFFDINEVVHSEAVIHEDRYKIGDFVACTGKVSLCYGRFVMGLYLGTIIGVITINLMYNSEHPNFTTWYEIELLDSYCRSGDKVTRQWSHVIKVNLTAEQEVLFKLNED